MALAFGRARADRAPGDEVGDVLRAAAGRGTRCRPAGRAWSSRAAARARARRPSLMREAAVETRVVDVALPADGGARLLEVDAHHDEQLVAAARRPRAFSRRAYSIACVVVVDRARADDDEQPVVAAVQDRRRSPRGCLRRAAARASARPAARPAAAPARSAGAPRRCGRRRCGSCRACCRASRPRGRGCGSSRRGGVIAAALRRARRRARCPGRRRCTSCTARSGRRCACSWLTAVVTRRAPLAPSGWPSAIAPPFGLTRASSSARPRSRSTARPCAAKASLSSITSICVERQAGQLEHLLRRRRRADAHDARRDAGRRHADDARARREAVLRRGAPRSASSSAQAPSLTPEALPAVTRAVRAARRPSAWPAPRARSRADARPCATTIGSPFFCGDRHRRDLGVEEAAPSAPPRPSAASASAMRSCASRSILKSVGDVLGRLGHRVDAVLLLHQLVDEAPADGGVVDRVAARERALGLGHHERRAAHALDAAGDHQLGLAGLDRARRACRPRPGPSRTGG